MPKFFFFFQLLGRCITHTKKNRFFFFWRQRLEWIKIDKIVIWMVRLYFTSMIIHMKIGVGTYKLKGFQNHLALWSKIENPISRTKHWHITLSTLVFFICLKNLPQLLFIWLKNLSRLFQLLIHRQQLCTAVKFWQILQDQSATLAFVYYLLTNKK